MATSIPQYAKALYEFLEDASEKELDERVKVFAQFLQSERMLKKKNAIIAAYEQYAKEQTGAIDITITSAHELTTDMIDRIKEMCHTTGNALLVQDKNIIGGVKVQRGNIIIDASLKTQLARLAHTLEA